MKDGRNGEASVGNAEGGGSTNGFSRRHVGAMLIGILAAGTAPTVAYAQAAAEDVRVVDFDWIDGTRGRPVPARLHWPNTSSLRSPVPLIVFSHGLGGSRNGYRYLGERWSARGVASLHVQHVGSDRSVWTGNPLELVDRLQGAADEAEAVERARDLRFALDRILDGRTSQFRDFIDPRRIVAAGHSFGANTTLLVTGARVVRNGRALGYTDPRFKAGIVISAPPFYGERDLKSVLRSVDVPTLHVSATGDVIELPGRFSPSQDRLDIFEAIGTPRKVLAVFQGGSHSMFTDRPLTGGVTLNSRVKEATAEIALVFLDLAFRADGAPLEGWVETWKPILAVAPSPYRLAGMPQPSRSRRNI